MITRTKQVGGRHYKTMSIQPWDAMRAWMTPAEYAGYLRGNAIKYLARAPQKGGMQDIAKAQHYLEELQDFYNTKPWEQHDNKYSAGV